jgi:DNA-binding NarL/FixJ family response regulator
MKQEALEKIPTAIRRVLGGSVYVSDALGAKMLKQQVRGQTDIQESPVKSLSDREVEVFHLIGQWKKTKEIAGELHLSVKTVEYYREQIKAGRFSRSKKLPSPRRCFSAPGIPLDPLPHFHRAPEAGVP